MSKKIIPLLIIIIFMLFAIKPLKGLLLSDEATAVQISRNLINSGSLTIDKYEGFPQFLGAHTALYFFLLGLIAKYFGTEPFLLRLPGLISIFLSVFLMRWAIMLLKPKEDTNRYFYFALVLFLLSPLVIQGAFILDLDCNLLVPTTLLAVILFLIETANPHYSSLVLFGLNLFLIFWIKETFLPIIVISFIAYLIMAKKRSYLLTRFLPTLAVITALAALSWYVFACAVKINPLSFIETDFINVFPSNFSSSIFARFSTFKNLFLWLTPMFSLFMLIFIIKDFAEFISGKTIERVELFAVSAFIIFFIYAVILPVKMTIRYWLPMMPLASIYLSIRFNEYISINTIDINKPALILLSILGLTYFMLLSDPIYFLNTGVKLAIPNLVISSNKMLKLFAFTLPAIILSGAFIIFKRKRKIVLLIFTIFTFCSMLSLNIWQAFADYSTAYYYGEKGYAQTIGYIRNKLPSSISLYARKDVGHYSFIKGRVFTEPTAQSSFLAELIRTEKIDYAVISDYFPLQKNALELIREKGKIVFENGNFKIYQFTPLGGGGGFIKNEK